MDLKGKLFTFSGGYVEFLGEDTIRTTWGVGGYTMLEPSVYTVYWNNHHHTFTFSSDFTSYTSVRTRPADHDIQKGNYISPMVTSTPWVSCFLEGGIGNRLFQLASVLGYAEKWNRKPVIYTHTNTGLSHQDNSNILKLFPELDRITDIVYTKPIYENPNSGYLYRDIPSLETNSIIHGYRQNLQYFPSYSILPSFSMFSDDTLRSIREKYKLRTTAERRNTWFIHIRLGDYCTINNLNHVTTKSYHRHLLHHIPDDANLLVLSNESSTAETLLKGHTSRSFTVCDEANECMALYIMAACWGGAIIPNSTFSWWGAYFAYHSTPYKSSYKAYLPQDWVRGNSYDISSPPWGIPSPVR